MRGDSYTNAVAITTSDTAFLARTEAIYCAGAGTLTVVMEKNQQAGTTTAFTVIAGAVLPISVVQVKATGTTATGIVGLSL